MHIKLRKTTLKDISFVIEAERSAENKQYIGQWEYLQHTASLSDKNLKHFILERTSDNLSVGYIILAGIGNIDQSIEFRRLVVTMKGFGYGKEALQLVKMLAFENWDSNRLWLDVRDHNVRALQLYKAAGFIEEGLLRECVKVDDHFESLIILSMLKSEYKNVFQAIRAS